ncbi:MAG: metalloregulator ArsR/SmtB family transcription factor [Clostridiaceae bacterium]|nr:metalloregulator ArsR/SmtB family transcription factor [Clostridiaceae bacterium]
MKNEEQMLKAISDGTRLDIVKLLLCRSFCVRSLARRLGLSDAAVSQHLKVLREAGIISGEKRGYFMHYDVNREELIKLSQYFSALAGTKQIPCNPDDGGCDQDIRKGCHEGRYKEIQVSSEAEKGCGKNGHCRRQQP